jgi:hypothetical protein
VFDALGAAMATGSGSVGARGDTGGDAAEVGIVRGGGDMPRSAGYILAGGDAAGLFCGGDATPCTSAGASVGSTGASGGDAAGVGSVASVVEVSVVSAAARSALMAPAFFLNLARNFFSSAAVFALGFD